MTNNDKDGGKELKGTDKVTFRKFLRDLTFNEIHLLMLGLWSGFVAIRPRRRQKPKKSLRKKLNWELNQWYYKMGYLGGYGLKAILTGAGLKSLGFLPF